MSNVIGARPKKESVENSVTHKREGFFGALNALGEFGNDLEASLGVATLNNATNR